MSNLVCSIALRKGVVAVLLIDGGMVKKRVVERVKDADAAESSYMGIIYAFKVALRNVRDYVQQFEEHYNVCFETSNSTFVKWIENQYSKEAYQEEFMGALRLLQELPIMYAFHYSPKPKALVYADVSYCKREKLSKLSVDEVDDE